MILLEFLKKLGIDLNDSTIPDVVALNLVYLILGLFCLGAFLNIMFYFFILLNKDNRILLNFIDKHWVLQKLFYFYINTTRYFLIIEIFLFLWSLSFICLISFKIVNAYFKIFKF